MKTTARSLTRKNWPSDDDVVPSPQMGPDLGDIFGNLEPSIDISPNRPGQLVRNAMNGQRELANFSVGQPTPGERTKGKADYGTTNIRHPQYGYCQQ